MGSTFSYVPVHFVFSTKHRAPLIQPDLADRLWSYMGGIGLNKKIRPLCVGGMPDHVHMLLLLPTTVSASKAMQIIKANSSGWVHETYPERSAFAWQDGYGAFAVCASRVEETVAYIKNQEEHHRKMTFKEEFIAFLRRHGIEYDERYIWD